MLSLDDGQSSTRGVNGNASLLTAKIKTGRAGDALPDHSQKEEIKQGGRVDIWVLLRVILD